MNKKGEIIEIIEYMDQPQHGIVLELNEIDVRMSKITIASEKYYSSITVRWYVIYDATVVFYRKMLFIHVKLMMQEQQTYQMGII